MRVEQINGQTYHVCSTQDEIDGAPRHENICIEDYDGDVLINRNCKFLLLRSTVTGNVIISRNSNICIVKVEGTVKGDLYAIGSVDLVWVSGRIEGVLGANPQTFISLTRVEYFAVNGGIIQPMTRQEYKKLERKRERLEVLVNDCDTTTNS